MKYEPWNLPRIFREAVKEMEERWNKPDILPDPHYSDAMCVCERVIKKYIENEEK